MSSNIKILIADKVHPLLVEGLKKENWDVDYKPDILLNDVRRIIHEYTAIVINTKTKMNADMLEKAVLLKCISRLGSGLDIIDLETAKRKNIAVFRSPEGNCNAVAEHAVGMLLSLINHLGRANLEMRNFEWHREKNRGVELSGKTIGIIGFGHTGSSFAKKLSCWDVNLIAYDKYKEQFGDSFGFVKTVSLEEIKKEADIISFHVPLTDETLFMLNEEFIDSCKKRPIIINTSRGKVVHTESLIKGLRTKQIKGACLDVIENEKTESYTEEEYKMYEKLHQFENVVLSPHVAGWTVESFKKIAEVTLNRMKIYLKEEFKKFN
jgi:D-3-phosphoglycerate dehydrogenase